MIEVLIVLALLLILTTLYWSRVESGPNKKLEACQLNLEKIYLAMEIYAKDNQDRFPAVTNALSAEEPLDLLVPHYTSDTSIFICPAGAALPLPPGEGLRDHKISYAYYMGRHSADAGEILMSDKQVDTRAKSKGDQVFSSTGLPPGNNHERFGGNLMFGDGRVETIKSNSPGALLFTTNIVLLNPKP